MARKMKTMDGNHAAAHVSYAYSDVAAAWLPSMVFIFLAIFVFPPYSNQ